MRKIYSVELLRGLAAIAVMGFHFQIRRDVPVLNWLFAHGDLGVDVFFLLSGFVIYYSTDHDRSPVNFAVRRLFRVVPLAWVCVAIAYLIMPRLAPPNLAADLFFFPADTVTGWAPVYHIHILPPIWTLSFEMWFYLNFAVTLWLFPQWRGTMATMQIVATLLVGQWIGSNLLTLDAHSPSLMGTAFIANPMVLYFPVGMLAGWLWRQDRIRLVSLPRPVATFAGALGSISYGIYLIHPMIEQAIGSVFFIPDIGPSALPMINAFVASPGYVQIAVLASLTIAFATLAHVVIERPAQKLGKQLIELLRRRPSDGSVLRKGGRWWLGQGAEYRRWSGLQ